MTQTSNYAALHLITGGSGSGKSAYAESLVMAASGYADFQRIYIATMIPYGEEGRRRVERHRKLRAEKKFETVECYTGLERLDLNEVLFDSGMHVAEDILSEKNHRDSSKTGKYETDMLRPKMILLECMSNLVANEMFEPGGAGDDVVNAILRGITVLRRQANCLIVVTNEVFSDGIRYDADTMRYLSYLGAVNQALAAQADRVTEVVYGIPNALK
ncbi:MAG: bifunctional adenosylcobinamide kinase/adenosylcobinamide-phosphate guanylyltransferase [Lachnospiraceae bacterium]|nr:bifunctional adenosylcobinamide kinase/adenosylcobinamide-phosphate guanylyltransferase [Lachnospiraceae bacterium]MCD7765796.1 bifunctional adenosylcobinamide kinase/adenosylcobinamide-phosphate guanylyltransferase [Lachnospiraceae bacterium]